jgi:hypothetical protein
MINQRPKKEANELKVVPNEASVSQFINRRKPKPQDPTKKKAIPVYLPPQLEAEVSADAEADFITRNAWITEACKFYLKYKRGEPKF